MVAPKDVVYRSPIEVPWGQSSDHSPLYPQHYISGTHLDAHLPSNGEKLSAQLRLDVHMRTVHMKDIPKTGKVKSQYMGRDESIVPGAAPSRCVT